MSLNALARIQATQVASSQESEKVSDNRIDVARKKQLEAIDKVQDHSLEVLDEKKKQDRKGIAGTIGGALTAVAVVALAAVAVAATAVTFGAGAVMMAGVVMVAATLPGVGQKVGHDLVGKANAVKAELLQRSAGYEEMNQAKAADRVQDAEESAEDASASADAAQRFAKQIRQHQRELSAQEVGS